MTLLFLIPGYGRAAAGEGEIHFERISIEEGLIQNTVNTILQDSLGFMWFGTDEGLNKYNGYEYAAYQHDPDDPTSLANNRILALYEDSRSNLWIGTGEGLDRLDRTHGGFQHIHLGGLGDSQTDQPAVMAIVEDNSGQVWIGTDGAGAWVITAEGQLVNRFRYQPAGPSGLSSNTIHQILLDQGGTVWIATAGGLDRYDPDLKTFSHFVHDPGNPDSPSGTGLRTVFVDSHGDVWLGTENNGLNRLNPHTGQFQFFLHSPVDPTSLSDNQVLSIWEDREQSLWIGTRMGLNRLDRDSAGFTRFLPDVYDPSSLSGSKILSLYEDRSGILWIGTEGAGISRYRPAAHQFPRYRSGPDSQDGIHQSSTSAILTDPGGRVWIGTGEAGISMLDRQTRTWQVFRHDPSDSDSLSQNSITALLQDREGDLWIGTASAGLERFDPDSGKFTYFRYESSDPESLNSNAIQALALGAAGEIWIGTYGGGVNRLDPKAGKFTHYQHDTGPASLSADRISSLLVDRSGRLWAGTWMDGLDLLDPATGKWTHFSHRPEEPGSLSSNDILSIHESPGGVIWVGTKDGLNQYLPERGGFKRYTSTDGLPSNTINCILSDSEEFLWLSTVNGLSRLDLQDRSFTNYGVEDGLQSREFIRGSCYRSAEGEYFFGGVRGWNAFSPSQVAAGSIPPPVMLTGFYQFNQKVKADLSPDEHIQLSYRDTYIGFEFAALDYNAPEQNRYAYRLEGFDPDWIEAGTRRFVSYTNLRGGEYTFRVKAANSQGIWNEEGAAVRLTVVPPVWELLWFRLVAGTIMTGSLAGGYWLRVRGIQKRNRSLEQKVTEMSEQLKASTITAERNRLARDLHDSVSQSLYSLTLLSEVGQRLLEAGDLSQAKEKLGRLGEIAQQALQEMRLMVYELRPASLDQVGLAGALQQRLKAIESRSGIEAKLVVEGYINLPDQIEAELYHIAQEGLNNALKHSEATTVEVCLRQTDDRIEIQIQDNGCGFDLEAAAKAGGVGLASLRERAEKLGGQLSIRSSPGTGTEILIRVLRI